MDVNIRIAGEAGQGIHTIGDLLVHALARMRVHVFGGQNYMSRIRGGLNWVDIRLGDEAMFSGKEAADVLVALTREALETHRQKVPDHGAVLYDGASEDGVVSLEFAKIAKELVGTPMGANCVAAGAIFALLGYDIHELCAYLDVEFEKKGKEVIQKNVACARRGAELMADRKGTIRSPKGNQAPETVYSGGETVGLGAATSGVKVVCSYPMSPSTSVLQYLASVADRYGIVVEQAEDEIAAINLVCGATYAGVPAMTTTSGGGFSLMVEGLSLAGMLEVPALVVLSQRPGPATGLPTRTAQEDLAFAIHAGHGEFPRAIFAPGTIDQAYTLTRHAAQISHTHQVPAILMTDQFLIDTQKNIPPLDASLRPIDRCVLENPPADYVRYAVTANGISPRALPGSSAFVVCDSDEHTEDGHITEDLDARVRLQDKRICKGQGLVADAIEPELYGPKDAEYLLITWGSTYGPVREAVDILQSRGVSAAMLHFAQVWPIDTTRVKSVLGAGKRGQKIISIEGNSTGQFATVLREVGVLSECELLLRYDGLPFTGGDVARRILG
jgi:2-oxoglutarate ferredoxin oxidoreductase subunit alpha